MAQDDSGDLTARERAVEEIRRQLAGGRWAPGAILQESDLAAQMGLSKTPVREALLTLSEHGLIRPVARVGYRIPEISLRDIAEVFSLRELIECQVAADAAGLRGAASALSEATAAGPAERERDFHQNLAALAAGRRTQGFLRGLLAESQRFAAHLEPDGERAARFLGEHNALLDAVLAGDLMLARALMTVHLTHMRESFMATLRQRLREQSELP